MREPHIEAKMHQSTPVQSPARKGAKTVSRDGELGHFVILIQIYLIIHILNI
jgi:hypothetical protein